MSLLALRRSAAVAAASSYCNTCSIPQPRILTGEVRKPQLLLKNLPYWWQVILSQGYNHLGTHPKLLA